MKLTALISFRLKKSVVVDLNALPRHILYLLNMKPYKRMCSSRASWHNINWRDVNRKVRQKQIEIRVAWKNNQHGKVKQLQDNLVRSCFFKKKKARLLAVQKVTTNKGKETPGVDNIIWDTPQKKL